MDEFMEFIAVEMIYVVLVWNTLILTRWKKVTKNLIFCADTHLLRGQQPEDELRATVKNLFFVMLYVFILRTEV
jgi:hypothetical protein